MTTPPTPAPPVTPVHSPLVADHASQLPAALPDHRTAQRLLETLDRLEHALRHATPSAPVQATMSAAERQALHTENAMLKARQQQAKERLYALLRKVEAAHPAPDAESAEGAAA